MEQELKQYNARRCRILIIEIDDKVFFALERQRLFRANLGARREDLGRDRPGRGAGGQIGRLNVEDTNVGDLDVLRFELPTQTSPVEGRTQDGCLISIDVERDLLTSKALDDARIQAMIYALSDGSSNCCLDHGCSRAASGKNDRCNIFLLSSEPQ